MNKLTIVFSILAIIVFIVAIYYLLSPISASYSYKGNYTDIGVYVPRWKILLFDLTGIK